MKVIMLFAGRLLFMAAILCLMSCQGDNPEAETIHADSLSVYDSALARELNADDFGMRPYVMAFLYRGMNKTLSKDSMNSLQKAHLKNISRLAADGLLSLAGPFLDTGNLRGIYVFNVPTLAEADSLVQTDPAIQAGTLKMELKKWYGPASLTMIPELNLKVQRASF